MIYWALCDYLEMTDCIADAIECLHQMNSELGKKKTLAKWVVGERLSSHACSVHVIDRLQTSNTVALKSWNTSETSQQRPNNTMKPVLDIQLHCLSTLSSHKTYSWSSRS